MDEIQKLIAPPISEDSAKRQQRRERKEYRKHGKAINHDYCDSCQEGGDLVCCDRCPVSFHLQCHDPPLEEEDIPPGEWVCHRCKTLPKELAPQKDDDTMSTKSSTSSHSRSSKCSQPSVIPIPVLSINPFHTLTEAAKLLNPVQFDLPKDIECHTLFPGSYKRKWWGKDKNMPQKKPAHELDNGLVPLPARLCFVCNKSCRVAPLLPCDYCPCYFHLDCLNPPMPSLPTERWMCPNHVERIIDEKLLKTTMLMERVKLWDKYQERINQHVVKMSFLKKVHRQNPSFRLKHRHTGRKSAIIPPAVKDFYAHPTDLLVPPTLNIGGTGGSSGENVETCCTDQTRSEISLEEQEQWLTSLVSLQTSIAQILAKKQLEHSISVESGKNSDSSKPEKPTASVQPVVNRDFSDQSVSCVETNGNLSNEIRCKSSNSSDQDVPNGPLVTGSDANGYPDINKGAVSLLNSLCNSFNGDIELSELSRTKSDVSNGNHQESLQLNVVKIASWPGGDKQSLVSSCTQTSGSRNIVISTVNKTNNVYTRVVPGIPGMVSGQTSILSPRGGNQTGKIGSAVLKTNVSNPASSKMPTLNQSLAAPKFTIPLQCKQTQVPVSGTNQASSAIHSLNNTLQQCLEGTADLKLTKLDEKLINTLAWQRLQQLTPSKSSTTDSQRINLGCINGLLRMPGLQEVQARAVLCPLSGNGEAVPMPYRTLSIGTGADMDVCLGQYGQCEFISARHAFIFYDENSKHYELLNYSEHGTTVDNVFYSCDFTDKPETSPQPSAIMAAVRHLNSKFKLKMKANESLTLTPRSLDKQLLCSCKGSSSSLIGGSGAGWEGTAILHHGSYIKVGCIQFVFSIVDHATLHPIHGVKREPISLLKPHLKGVP